MELCRIRYHIVLPDFRDAEAAADRILQLLHVERRKAMGEAAQLKAREQTWERLTKNMAEIYEHQFIAKVTV